MEKGKERLCLSLFSESFVINWQSLLQIRKDKYRQVSASLTALKPPKTEVYRKQKNETKAEHDKETCIMFWTCGRYFIETLHLVLRLLRRAVMIIQFCKQRN